MRRCGGHENIGKRLGREENQRSDGGRTVGGSAVERKRRRGKSRSMGSRRGAARRRGTR